MKTYSEQTKWIAEQLRERIEQSRGGKEMPKYFKLYNGSEINVVDEALTIYLAVINELPGGFKK